MAGIGRSVGYIFSTSRDRVARVLLAIRIGPNMLTLIGLFLTISSGVCFALGTGKDFAWTLSTDTPGNAWLFVAGVVLFFAFACDMLDGAVARIGNCGSEFGAFFDSTIDRLSDFVIFMGILMGYAMNDPANLTFILLSAMAFFNAFGISYAKARAENLIESCPVGYWQRGERSAAVIISAFAANMPALVIQQGILPVFTFWRRVGYVHSVMTGKPVETDPAKCGWWVKCQLWRWRRMSWQYDVITLLNIAWLIFASIEPVDVLRKICL